MAFLCAIVAEAQVKEAKVLLVDLAKGLGPAGPGQVGLGREGCKAQQVAHNW